MDAVQLALKAIIDEPIIEDARFKYVLEHLSTMLRFEARHFIRMELLHKGLCADLDLTPNAPAVIDVVMHRMLDAFWTQLAKDEHLIKLTTEQLKLLTGDYSDVEEVVQDILSQI